MTTTALACGNIDHSALSFDDVVRWTRVGSPPERQQIDPLLGGLHGRLVVYGTDADLAAVVLRLLRKGRLTRVTVGYVPVVSSPASALWSIPAGAFELAFTGTPRPVPVVRDDSGGVLVAAGVVDPITGQVYCDDQRMLEGRALRMEVAPDPAATPLAEPTADPLATTVEPATDGIRVTLTHRRLLRKRHTVAHGRAVQASFEPATVFRDGVAHPRPARTWGWYRHTEDLLLVS